MKLGQIPENVYNRSVVRGIQYRNNDIKGGVVSKETCAFFMDKEIAFSESKTAALKELNGSVGIYSSVNALLAKGATPRALNINLLMPHRFSEEKLKFILGCFEEVATHLNVSIASFSGEMLNPLTEAIVSVNAIGDGIANNDRNAKLSTGDIVLTKWVGMAGTAIIADNKRDELLNRFSASYIDGMYALKDYLSISKETAFINKIVNEAACAGKSGAIKTLEVSKGGIYKALWDLGEMCSSGLEVELKNIPIKQETVEICNHYDLNPYELYSEGCLLIVCPNGSDLVNRMYEDGISAQVIGRLTSDNDRVIINDYERKFLTKPAPDEMTKLVL